MVTRLRYPSNCDCPLSLTLYSTVASRATGIAHCIFSPSLQNMQFSYIPHLLPNPWPRLDDMATENSSPTTTTSTHASINHPSGTPVLFSSSGYHYKKKSVNNNLTTTDNMRLTESSGGNLTPKDVMHNGVGHTGKIHKANFSLPSFIGGAPIDTKRCDPSPRSASGASGRDLNQGPNQEHNLESGIQNKLLEALGPAHTFGRLRKSSSAMSLKLKIPRFSLKQQKNKDSMDSHFSAASLSEDLPLSSNAVYRLGRMAFQRNGSVDSMSRSSKDGILPQAATNLPSRPATSMTLRNEEASAPATPRTIAHRSSVLNSRQNVEDKSVLSHDAVPDGSENRNSGTRRAHPTLKTQDDISLDTHSAIGKYKSWRLNRRASLSATTNLLSFSESRALSTSQSSLKLDRCSKDDIEFPTRVNLGNSEIPECPTPSSSPMHKYSTEDLFIPTSLIHTDMTIPPSNDTPLHHSKPPIPESTSTSTSRAPSSDSRVSTPELTSVSSLYTTSSISSHPQKNTPTPAQLAQWREDAETVMVGLDDEFDGEVCVVRYEARQCWFGFWNKESITDVINELRELRSPRT